MNDFTISRRKLIAAAAGGLAITPFAKAQNANWPNRHIRLIIPYGTGGATDAFGRLLATRLADILGQSVVVENKPGANGIIGTAELARTPPDGYAFCIVSSTHVVNPFINTTLGYDPRADFAPVTRLTRMSSVLVTHPSVPAKTMQELVALVQKNPDKYFYGIAGGLSNGHITMERLKNEAGLKVTPVMFAGAGPAALELLAGRIHMMIVAPPGVKAFIDDGKLNVLASSGSRNPVGFSNLPNFADAGYPQLESYEWLGLLTRAGTPQPIIDQMHAAVAKAVEDPVVRRTLEMQSQELVVDSPQEFNTFINNELDRFSVLVKQLDLKG